MARIPQHLVLKRIATIRILAMRFITLFMRVVFANPRRTFARHAVGAVLLLTSGLCGLHAQDTSEDLPPYRLIRSLQIVQDEVVLGDHSLLEMQKFLLATIDKRLRDADPAVFNDSRNLDAAMIYAMSGGNPKTLEFLVYNDAAGNFDVRVTEALLMYLNGKGEEVVKGLEQTIPEYKTSPIGPYLALVAANALSEKQPDVALKYYDWARLMLPGTIIEEASLRRAIFITLDHDMIDKAKTYSNRYARRFSKSPYVAQFTDRFVSLAVDHFGDVSTDDISEVLRNFDPRRQTELYLRISRRAAVIGKMDLAKFASDKALELAGETHEGPASMANLYGSMAVASSADAEATLKRIAEIPETDLSDKDRALRDAAKFVAEQVLKKPEAESLRQADAITPDSGKSDAAASDMPQKPETTAQNPAQDPGKTDGSAPDADPAFQTFVKDGQSKLEAVDALLKEGN